MELLIALLLPAVQSAREAARRSSPLDYWEFHAGQSRGPGLGGDESLTVKLRYKQPKSDESELITQAVVDEGLEFDEATQDFQFATSVAMFGMILRDSKHLGTTTFDSVIEIADRNRQQNDDPYRAEFVELVTLAKSLRR